MISKFKNQFKKSDLDEKNAFCLQVISTLKEIFPNHAFVCDENGEVIKVDELTFGLTNLRSKFLLTSQTGFELKELVGEHFNSLFAFLESEVDENASWNSAKTIIMPQLMPVEFISRMPIVSFPFGDEVAIGIVVDSEKSYQYVTQEDLQTWGASEDEIYQLAVKNLMEKSFNLEMTFVPPPNGIVVVDTMDGFDAARVIVPEMQDFFAEKLGSVFYFAVPNRDFLICWSKQGDEEFQTSMKRQITNDFDKRPYPLSKSVFEFDKNEGIGQLKD